MMKRDFNVVVNAVLEVIPADEKVLRSRIEHAKTQAAYQAPEVFAGWHMVTGILRQHLLPRLDAKVPWAVKVHEVWTGSPLSE